MRRRRGRRGRGSQRLGPAVRRAGEPQCMAPADKRAADDLSMSWLPPEGRGFGLAHWAEVVSLPNKDVGLKAPDAFCRVPFAGSYLALWWLSAAPAGPQVGCSSGGSQRLPAVPGSELRKLVKLNIWFVAQMALAGGSRRLLDAPFGGPRWPDHRQVEALPALSGSQWFLDPNSRSS